MALKIIGGALVVFGLIDMGGSWAGQDVWGDWIGVQLPAAIWMFTAWIEIGIGSMLFKLGSATEAA